MLSWLPPSSKSILGPVRAETGREMPGVPMVANQVPVPDRAARPGGDAGRLLPRSLVAEGDAGPAEAPVIPDGRRATKVAMEGGARFARRKIVKPRREPLRARWRSSQVAPRRGRPPVAILDPRSPSAPS